jgi:hypothetical protein
VPSAIHAASFPLVIIRSEMLSSQLAWPRLRYSTGTFMESLPIPRS